MLYSVTLIGLTGAQELSGKPERISTSYLNRFDEFGEFWTRTIEPSDWQAAQEPRLHGQASIQGEHQN